MRWFKKVLKEVRKTMRNEKISDIMEVSKEILMDIAKDQDAKTLLSNVFIGAGLGIGAGLTIIGVLIRIS